MAWIKDGRIRMLGEPKRTVDAYLQDIAAKQEEDFQDKKVEVDIRQPFEDGRRENRWGKREIEICAKPLRQMCAATTSSGSPSRPRTKSTSWSRLW